MRQPDTSDDYPEQLNALPPAVSATHDEVLRVVEDRKLWGQAVGWNRCASDSFCAAVKLQLLDARPKAASDR